MCLPAITQNRFTLAANSTRGKDVREVLLIVTIALTGIAALACLSTITKTQPLCSFFRPLDWKGSLFLTGIGVIASTILCLPSLCTPRPPAQSKKTSASSTPESSTQSRETKKEILVKLVEQAEQLSKHSEEKLYFDLSSQKFLSSKEGISPEQRVTLKRLPNGHYHAKTKQPLGKGKDKVAYLEFVPTDHMRSEVRTVETEPSNNYEETIYEQLSSSPYVVHCYHTERTKKGKRVMYLEDCDRGTVAGVGATLTKPQIKTLFSHYYLALAALTKIGYLHLDLHRDNLFIKAGADGSLEGRLGDFGSSRPMKDVMDMSKFLPKEKNFQDFPCCTPLISPEIAQAIVDYRKQKETKVRIDEKADVWALGIGFAKCIAPDNACLKAIISAQTPYKPFKTFFPLKGKTGHIQAYLKTLQKKYPTEPDSEMTLQHLIWELLHPDPTMRPTAKDAANRIKNLQLS